MKKIVIDVDEVICNTTFLYYINEFLNTNYELDDFDNYYLDDVIPEEQKNDFYDFYINHDVYDKAQLIDGAYDGLKWINDNYELYLLSSCIMFNKEKESGKLFMDKYNFILNKLPFLNPERIIFSNIKNMIVSDIQVDDRLKHLLGPVNEKILFTAYHNKKISNDELKQYNIKRINNWSELIQYLKKIKEQNNV